MQYVYDKGFMKGDGSAATFNPTSSITCEELEAMLWRYMNSPVIEADLSAFSESAPVSSWAVDATQRAVSTSLLQGDNGRLHPGSDATRAQVVTILIRYCENIAR